MDKFAIFDSDFEEISSNRVSFSGAEDYADRELKKARQAAGGAGPDWLPA